MSTRDGVRQRTVGRVIEIILLIELRRAKINFLNLVSFSNHPNVFINCRKVGSKLITTNRRVGVGRVTETARIDSSVQRLLNEHLSKSSSLRSRDAFAKHIISCVTRRAQIEHARLTRYRHERPSVQSFLMITSAMISVYLVAVIRLQAIEVKRLSLYTQVGS